jgi:hypothetical protein
MQKKHNASYNLVKEILKACGKKYGEARLKKY